MIVGALGRGLAGRKPTYRSLSAKSETHLPGKHVRGFRESERADVRDATSRNDWRCLNGWSDC